MPVKTYISAAERAALHLCLPVGKLWAAGLVVLSTTDGWMCVDNSIRLPVHVTSHHSSAIIISICGSGICCHCHAGL